MLSGSHCPLWFLTSCPQPSVPPGHPLGAERGGCPCQAAKNIFPQKVLQKKKQHCFPEQGHCTQTRQGKFGNRSSKACELSDHERELLKCSPCTGKPFWLLEFTTGPSWSRGAGNQQAPILHRVLELLLSVFAFQVHSL